MGYAECSVTMESRTGSSPGVRGQTLKSNPFCHRSSSKLTQSIIKDHMVSHYKKVYSAKAAIDNSVPKSLLSSVKYHDQVRQERLRKGARPLSAQSFLQRSSKTPCSPTQSQLSVRYDGSPYLCSGSSISSGPRFTTSFNAKDIVYPSCKVSTHHTRPASEIKYRSPGPALQRKQSAGSLAALGDQGCYKTFQDPVQKTYGGDLIHKHAQHFTQDKPFTPKTLKSDKSSYLSKYRYYRAPPRKPTQDFSHSRMMRQETYHGSPKNEEYTQELNDQSQEYSTEHEWSEDEVNGTYLSALKHQSRTNKKRQHYSGSLSRFSPGGGESPIMSRVSAEEEELMYLEFISAVTEDILSRGHISDRVLNRVMKRHIDMNLHQLDEAKMRHLLEVLRKDFEEPVSVSSSNNRPEKKEKYLLDTVFSQMESGGMQGKAKHDIDPFDYTSLIKHNDLPELADPILVSTPLCSPERTSVNTNEEDRESNCEAKGNDSPLMVGNVTDNEGNSQENFYPVDSTTTNNHTENNDHSTVNTALTSASTPFDGELNEIEDLGKSLSVSLHLSSNTHSENVDTSTPVASVSDDDF
ncbi:spermatogenesis-associated protein 7 homolog isoform 2-T2 [Menidia menidia]